jgi:hypothetical protein
MAEPSEIIIRTEVGEVEIEQDTPTEVIVSDPETFVLSVPESVSLEFQHPSEIELLTLTEQGPPGPPGTQGEKGEQGDKGERGEKGEPGAGGDAFYLHQQDAPAKEWIVVHDLNKFPSVTVVDSANSEVIGDCVYLDRSALRLIFSAPFSGLAYLN